MEISKNQLNSYVSYSDTFKIFEGFNTYGYKNSTPLDGNSIIANQITPLTSISKDYSVNLSSVDSNYIDLSNNIANLLKIRKDISGNKYYDYNTPFTMNKPKTMLDGMIYDNNQLNIQENAMYILGTITAVSLIVFAIVIGKE